MRDRSLIRHTYWSSVARSQLSLLSFVHCFQCRIQCFQVFHPVYIHTCRRLLHQTRQCSSWPHSMKVSIPASLIFCSVFTHCTGDMACWTSKSSPCFHLNGFPIHIHVDRDCRFENDLLFKQFCQFLCPGLINCNGTEHSQPASCRLFRALQRYLQPHQRLQLHQR